MFEKIKRVISRVPRGRVATYGQIATLAGFPGAARQVVWALRGSFELPWHRIVGAGGKISLTGEPGFEQRMRLQSEGVVFNGLRVDMQNYAWQPSKAASRRSGSKKIIRKASLKKKGRS
jgi:methylated-DNA-protein-cysteine methyltransferase-like protein